MYMINVEWSEEDGEYVATSPLYPSLSWIAPTDDEAYESLQELIYQVQEEERHGLT